MKIVKCSHWWRQRKTWVENDTQLYMCKFCLEKIWAILSNTEHWAVEDYKSSQDETSNN